jgi:acyl CoA:acetate/3-ketoacid CoA transferase alpha subunit
MNANHIHSVKEGKVIAIATIIHQGKSTQVWHIEIKDDTKRLFAYKNNSHHNIIKATASQRNGSFYLFQWLNSHCSTLGIFFRMLLCLP